MKPHHGFWDTLYFVDVNFVSCAVVARVWTTFW